MMALNAVKEQCGVGKLRAAEAGDSRGLVVTAGGSGQTGWGDGAEPLALGICRVGVFLRACPVVLGDGILGGDRSPRRVPRCTSWGWQAPQERGARQGLETPRFTSGRAMALAAVFCSQALALGRVPLKIPARN